ncbi:DUF6159 family protein [Alkalisalibacterium limincola]|uniref:Glycerophosphoryl diester phosphodiesterase membrane domain-containing protein n=1 Tax=Alkalisalibacterium limincola TaxID=2699169 RepID=A0A5C8KXT4_9GAMM|nr:DUF6159 family protein [Alkalisalibacterium limincola]TXK64884.1 hypothetical protein FU658_03340 [Alkalisalibacterium limincola]
MFERFSRSWELVRASAAVLKSDRHLLVFPLVAGIAALVVTATFVLPMFGLDVLGGVEDDFETSAAFYLWLFAFYVAHYFVMVFFNVALVGAAMIRLDGGEPTLRAGLAIALDRIGPIFGYAVIAATVGIILRALEQRAGFIGRLVVGLVGVAWTVATFLVVPVLVAQRVGPVDAVKRSATLLRRSWGENLIGNAGIGLAFGLLIVLVLAGGGALSVMLLGSGATGGGILLASTTVVLAILLGLVQAALAGIYSAALYRYAVDGEAPQGFDGAMLAEAFQRKV